MIARGRLIAIAAGILVVALTAFAMRPRPDVPPMPLNHGDTETRRIHGEEENSSPPAPLSQEASGEAKIENSDAASANAKTLSLIGSVVSGAQATLSVRQPTRIASVLVRDGDTVRRGQLLIQLDDRDIAAQALAAQAGVRAAQDQSDKALLAGRAQISKAEADAVSAQAGLTQAQIKLQEAKLARDAARAENSADQQTAQEAVRKARIALETAQRNLTGLEALDKVGGVSRNDLEGARSQVTVAQSDLHTAEEQAKRAAEGPPGSSEPYRVAQAQQEVDAAQAGVQQSQKLLKLAQQEREEAVALADKDARLARAALDQAQAQAAGALVTQQSSRLLSPLNGVATNAQARAGETAQPGSPLVSIVSLSDLRVEALVPGRQLSLLRTGQAASIRVDTQPGKTFPSTVAEIARVAEPDGRTFRVKFRFRSPTQRPTRPDQTARITVQLI